MSLVAWFPLNGNINNNGLSGTITTGTPSYNTGKINAQALSLSTKVSGTIPELVGAKTWSISFWCLINADDTLSGDWVDILGVHDRKSDDSATGEFRWETCYGSQKNNVAIGQYDNTVYATMTTNGAALTATKGGWHFCAAVTDFEKGVVSIYLDSTLKYTKVHAGGWLLGDFWLGQNNAVNGSIQDVRFYNHALSKKEVLELNKGLIMHLPLDWGGNPNMIKNSYTWMGKNLGSSNGASETRIYTKTMLEDDTAPCKWVLKCQVQNAGSSQLGGCGVYYGYSAQGLALTDLIENETYTYSFWAKSDSGVSSGLGSGSICESQTKLSDTGFGALNSNWRKHTVTFTWTKTTKLTACFYTTVPAGTTIDFEVCGIKLEKGSKATPYIPNVEETAYINDSYSTKYLQDCSGYNYTVSGYGSNNTSCISPKGSSGTNCGSGSCIVLGKTCKIQYPMSFAFWFNTSDLNNSNNRLISCTEGGGWNIELNGNYLCWTTGTGTSSNAYKYCISTKTYTELQGAWHHVACTYDGLKSQIYIDGELSKETTHFTTATPLYYNANNGVFLAAEAGGSATNPGTTYTTETKLADFRMYATVITADDIKELYQVGMQIDKSGNIYCNELVEE